MTKYLFSLYYKGAKTPKNYPLIDLTLKLKEAGVSEYIFPLPYIFSSNKVMFGCEDKNYEKVQLMLKHSFPQLISSYESYPPGQ